MTRKRMMLTKKAPLAAIALSVLAMATLVTLGSARPPTDRDEKPSDDEAEVRAAAQAYLDGLLHGDVATLESAFHPETRFQGSVRNAFVGMTFSDWAESRRGKLMRPVEDYRHSIEDVLISGDAAVVRTDIDWPGTYFVDYLSLLRIDDEWKIVNKIWTQRPNPRAMGRIDDEPYFPGEDAFAPEFDLDDRLEFERSADSRADRAPLVLGDTTIVAERVADPES